MSIWDKYAILSNTFAIYAQIKMDNLELLRVFLKVTESGSFSAAARELSVAPSSVSRQISDLEQSIEVRLFTRTTRQLTLTDAGEIFKGHAARILSDVDEAQHALRDLEDKPAGTLRLSAPLAFGRLQVAPMVNAFLHEYPEVDIELSLSDQRVDLVQGGIDAAIRVGELPDSTMVARELAPFRRRVFASPDYLKAHGRPDKPEDLRQHACLRFRPGNTANLWRPGTDVWSLHGAKGKHDIQVNGPLVSTSADALTQAAISGLGIAFLVDWVAKDAFDSGQLETILDDYTLSTKKDPAAIYIIYPSGRFVSARLRSFIDHAVDYMSKVTI